MFVFLEFVFSGILLSLRVEQSFERHGEPPARRAGGAILVGQKERRKRGSLPKTLPAESVTEVASAF